jgi:hypothetical protein
MTDILLGRDVDGAPVRMTEDIRGMHLHIIGGTRRGKSTLMRRMILEDIKAGHGVCVIDPHGTLINRVMGDLSGLAHPFGRSWPVRLIEPGRPDFTAILNPFSPKEDNSTAVSRIIGAILSAWGEFDQSKTPRLARVLSLMCSTLLDQGMPLSDALILLNNRDIRMQIIQGLADSDLKEAWGSLVDGKESVFREYVESTVNRLYPFISSASVRRMFGMTGKGLDFRKLIEERSIVLINLASSPYFDQASSKLVGSLIINEIRQASMLRSIDGLTKPRPFYLYIDECALFLTQDIISALDECSKFGLHLTLVHQRFAQLEEKGDEVLSAVLDIQNRIVFGGSRVEDLDILARELFTGTIRLDEYIEGTQEPTPIGQREEELVSKSMGLAAAEAEGEVTAQGVVDSKTAGKSLSGSISRNPVQKTITDGGEQEPVSPASYTLGGSLSGNTGTGKARSNSKSKTRVQTLTQSETVTVGRPKYHAWISVTNTKARLFPVQAIADPTEKDAKAFQRKTYEKYRMRVFEQMIERNEAMPSAEIDIAISARQRNLRETDLNRSDDEPDNYRV